MLRFGYIHISPSLPSSHLTIAFCKVYFFTTSASSWFSISVWSDDFRPKQLECANGSQLHLWIIPDASTMPISNNTPLPFPPPMSVNFPVTRFTCSRFGISIRIAVTVLPIIIDIKNNKAQISHLPFVNRGLNTKAIKRVIFLVVLTSHPSPNSHAWHAAPYSPPHPPYELSFPLPSFNVNHMWPVKDELPSLRELPEGAIWTVIEGILNSVGILF